MPAAVLDKFLNRFRAPRSAPVRDRNQESHDRSMALYSLQARELQLRNEQQKYREEYLRWADEQRQRAEQRIIAELSRNVGKSAAEAVAGQFDIERKANGEQPIINDGAGNWPSIRVHGSVYGMPGATWTPDRYEHVAREGYAKNSDAFACISLIASAGKQVRWADGRTGSKCLTAPEVLAEAIGVNVRNFQDQCGDQWRQKLQSMVKPNASAALLDKAGGAAFIEAWLSHLLISGNAYIEIIRKGATISMVYLDNPGLVTAEVNRASLHYDTLIDHWVVRNGYGSRRRVNPWREGKGEMVQSRLFSPIPGPYGMPPLQAAMMKIDMQNEGQTLMKRVLQRGYVPGWIEADEQSEWTDEHVATLKERVRQSKYHGEELFLQGAKWHEMGFRPQDSGLADQQILTKRDIASVFHVDPALIGDTTARTYATYRESRRALYMESILPLLTQFRDDWNRTIGTELRSPLDFDRDSFDAITAAREEAADRATKLWQAGLITQNEGRSDLEYARVEGGDVFYAPANFLPLSGAGEAEPEDEE